MPREGEPRDEGGQKGPLRTGVSHNGGDYGQQKQHPNVEQRFDM